MQRAMDPDQIRSLLFVPASASNRITKALASAGDLVCLDLEDGVGPEEKSSARSAVLARLASADRRDRICVRINPLSSPDGLEDTLALVQAPLRPGFLMLPKVESARDMELLAHVFQPHPSPRLIALLETPLGIEAAFTIAGSAAVSMLLFGSFDYAAQTGCAQDWSYLLPARSRVVAAAASAGKWALDSPFSALDDLSAAAEEARMAHSLGFSGKAALHPKFLTAINDAFTPTDAEIEEARIIVAAHTSSGRAASRIGGTLVEAPVVQRMQRLLDRAERCRRR
jgi:citrate lyase beta subunit